MNKKSTSTTILEEKTSNFIFLIPTILTIITIIYVIGYKNINFISMITLIVFYYIYPIIIFYKRKLVVKNNRLDIYFLGKKENSIHYLKDFYSITYQQDKLGKFLNYGSLIIIDQNKKIYSYHFLNEIFKTYEIIIKTYEEYMVSKNKNYVKTYEVSTNADDEKKEILNNNTKDNDE